MKIVALSTHSSGGGAFVAASNLVSAINKQVGYQAQIVSLDIGNSIVDKIRFLLNIILDRSLKKLFIRTTNPIFHSSGIFGKYTAKKIDAYGADLVVVHWFSNGLISTSQLAKLKSPYVLHIHDSWLVCGFEHHPNNSVFSNNLFDRWLSSSKRKVIANAKGIIFPSLWQQSIFLRKGHIKPLTKVIPNVVPFCAMPREVDPTFNQKKEVFVGIVAHRIFNNVAKGGIELENIMRLLNAMLNKCNLFVSFNIVGKLSRNIPTVCLNLENIRINELGTIEHTLMPEFFTGIDLFLNPSRFENLSTTNIEACSFGKPIVCFDVGGNSEMVIDQVSGFLCQPSDCEEVASRLFQLITNIQMRNAFSAQSLSLFESKFSKTITIRNTLDFYSEALQNDS